MTTRDFMLIHATKNLAPHFLARYNARLNELVTALESGVFSGKHISVIENMFRRYNIHCSVIVNYGASIGTISVILSSPYDTKELGVRFFQPMK